MVLVYDGLGNQLSKYAFHLRKKMKGQKCQVCCVDTDHNGIELGRLFHIDTKAGAIYKFIWLYFFIDCKWPKWGTRLKKLLKRLHVELVCENSNYAYQENCVENRSEHKLTFYQGAWQNPQYFDDIKETLQSLYQFPPLDPDNQRLLDEALKRENAVAIHVRGGDYLSARNSQPFGSVCTERYYQNAIDYVEKEVPTPTYYVFTNDIGHARKILGERQCVYMCHNRGLDSWKDMAMMSKFKHIIIPNSSFSWWAAYLGEKDKRVLCPPIYIGGNPSSESVFPKEWIRISNV